MNQKENEVNQIIKQYDKEKKDILNDDVKYVIEIDGEKEEVNFKNLENELDSVNKELKSSDREIQHIDKIIHDLEEQNSDDKELMNHYKEEKDSLVNHDRRKELLEKKDEINKKIRLGKPGIEENKNRRLQDAENKVRGELTRKSIEIDKEIEDLDLEMKITLKEMRDFKYEKDDNGKIINGEEFKKLDEKYKQQMDKKQDLKNAKNLCENKLKEFKENDKKKVEKLNEILQRNSKIAGEQKTEQQETEQQETEQQGTEQQETEQQGTEQQETEQQETEQQETGEHGTEQQGTESQEEELPGIEPEGDGSREIYSHTKNIVDSIAINAAEGKAYVEMENKYGIRVKTTKELDIENILSQKKEILENMDIDSYMEEAGETSRFSRFMAKRKINPVILEAIKDDEDMIYYYVESVLDKSKFPFNYSVDLSNSSLPNKETRKLNKIALKEKKIEGNEVKGAQRFYAIKNIFKNFKNRDKLSEVEPKAALPKGKDKVFDDDFFVDIEELEKEQRNNASKIYDELSEEQKAKLKEMSVSDIQISGISRDYSMASKLKEMYGKEETIEEEESTEEVKEEEEER